MDVAAGHQPQILWVRAPDGTTEHVDPLGAALVGRAPDEICGRPWFELVHPDDVEAARRRHAEASQSRQPYEAELRVRVLGGHRRMIERGSPVFASDGSIARWAGTLTDIDDHAARARTQRSLSEANETRALLDTIQSSPTIGFLFIDRDMRYRRVNEKVAAIHGSSSAADHLGHTVAEVVPALWPQLEPVYRRVLATGEPVSNMEVTGPTAEDPGHMHSWLESIAPVRVGDETVGLGVVLIDITERRKSETALAALTEAAVDAIAAATEARDPYTAGHQRRVAELSVAIATEIGVDRHDIEGVRIAAKIHDVGKLRMPSEILNKPGQLSRNELGLLREHARAGFDIVQGIDFPWPIADMILQHHERIDGSGYPSQLVGDEILLGARIIAVADIVDAMSSHRPYRPSRGVAAALRHIEHERGKRLDAGVVNVCVRLFRERHFSFSQGRQRVVVRDL